MPHYIAYGLHIDAALSLPELRPLSDSTTADITITLGDTPETLNHPVETSARWQTKVNELLLQVDGVARYWVTDGKHIVIQTAPDADDASVRLFLLGSAMGAALLQRNYLPLHANCVVYRDKAFAFAGRSGIGKSTLAAALAQQGCEVLTDDVCAIDFTQSTPQVYAAGANIKLWQHSLDKLALGTRDLAPIRPAFEKYLYPVESLDPQRAYPLQKIYFLSQHNVSEVSLQEVPAKTMIRLLKRHTFREFFSHGMGCAANNFKQYLQLIGQVDTLRITRPKSGFSLDTVVEKVLKDLKQYG